MSDLQGRFDTAQDEVKTLAVKPGNADLLELYSLFKQATAGEASVAKKPGRFDLVGRAKYDAWEGLAGMSADDAKAGYVAKVDSLLRR